MNNELSNSDPKTFDRLQAGPGASRLRAAGTQAAGSEKAEKPIFRPFRREFDDDYWRRVDDAIDDIKLREFEKEEG